MTEPITQPHCFIIAEAGVNHNGDVALAKRLVDAAADAGADAVKFQTFLADAVVAAGTGTVDYQRERAGEGDQHKLLQDLELNRDEWLQIVKRCEQRGIEFMSTGFDVASFELLLELGIQRVKIPSGEVTNHPMIRQLAEAGLPIILSSGMANLQELEDAANLVREAQSGLKNKIAEPELIVLQCTSAYPTPKNEANLRAMNTIAEKLDVPVGFSDHTTGILLSPATVAMGGVMIEKHFTLDRSMPGPDHAASLEPNELAAMIEHVRTIESAMGDGVKVAQPAEIQSRSLARRGIKVARDLSANHIITAEDLTILRPETGISPTRFDWVIGRTVRKPLLIGEPLREDDLLG